MESSLREKPSGKGSAAPIYTVAHCRDSAAIAVLTALRRMQGVPPVRLSPHLHIDLNGISHVSPGTPSTAPWSA